MKFFLLSTNANLFLSGVFLKQSHQKKTSYTLMKWHIDRKMFWGMEPVYLNVNNLVEYAKYKTVQFYSSFMFCTFPRE